jgi:hypothetical protein
LDEPVKGYRNSDRAFKGVLDGLSNGKDKSCDVGKDKSCNDGKANGVVDGLSHSALKGIHVIEFGSTSLTKRTFISFLYLVD